MEVSELQFRGEHERARVKDAPKHDCATLAAAIKASGYTLNDGRAHTRDKPRDQDLLAGLGIRERPFHEGSADSSPANESQRAHWAADEDTSAGLDELSREPLTNHVIRSGQALQQLLGCLSSKNPGDVSRRSIASYAVIRLGVLRLTHGQSSPR